LSQTLSVRFRPSRILALALTAVVGSAIVCAWIGLPRPAFLPVAAGIALAWLWHLAPALQRGRRAVRALELTAQGEARWQDGCGTWEEAEIRPGSYVSNWMIVLSLAGPGRRGLHLVLLPDSAAAEDLRRLRVWLRWRLGRQ
jgi:toxin CptA